MIVWIKLFKEFSKARIPALCQAHVNWARKGQCQIAERNSNVPVKAMRRGGYVNEWLVFTRRIMKPLNLARINYTQGRLRSDVKIYSYLVETCLAILPPPAIVSYELCPVIVVGACSLCINTKINRTASSQAFAPTAIDRSLRKLRLRHCFIAPVVPWCHQGPKPLAKALVLEIGVIASSVNKKNTVYWQSSSQARCQQTTSCSTCIMTSI